MICLAGLPGSGKTTWAMEFLKANPDYLYFSPDAYYERINGDDRIRKNTFEVWMTMFQEIHKAEMAGCNVLIDCDNLTYAQRNQWIEWFPGFGSRYLFYIEPDFSVCLDRVSKRRRTIPEDIMRKKALKWQNPANDKDGSEWDSIIEICGANNGKIIEWKGR
jgi:predicted kinase